MGLSPDKSRISYRRILYRAGIAAACAALLISCPQRLAAQEERPQITPGERKPTQKKDAGPRAIGLLQLDAKGKSSLIPIAILVNGKFWDATAYKADPIPMSLDSGTIYEVERTGNSLGLFTVGGVLKRNANSNLPPWLATGSYRPTGTEPESKPIEADTVPVGIDRTDERPRLTRDPNAAKTAPAASGEKPKESKPPAPAPKNGSADSDEPPRLSKGSSSSDEPATPPQNGPGSSPAPADKSKATKADQKPSIPASDSGAAQGNRPILRRGRPTESFADDDVPGYSRPGTTSGTAARTSSPDKKPAELAAATADIQLIPAISDAGGPAPHSYAFEWLKGEEEDRRKQMTDLATQQVQAYAAARAKATLTAQQPARPGATKRPAKATLPILENVQMQVFDLWNSNQPIMVLSAQAHMPPPAAGSAHSDVDTEMQYSVLLVAYPDIYNNLRKLYSGVTDKFHLDMTPKLDLIDAVDADGDSRGELLFRETTDQGTGWVVYRATADKLWKLFDSLNPE